MHISEQHFSMEVNAHFPTMLRQGGEGHHLNQGGRAAAEQGLGQGLQSCCTACFTQILCGFKFA